MFRDLLVHVDGTQAGRRRVKLALDLAKRTESQLSGLHVTPPPEVPPRYKPSRVAGVEADISRYLAIDAQSAERLFSEETSHQTNISWHQANGDMVEGICERARYADLVLLGQYEWQGTAETHPLPVAHRVVLRSGRPVLVVPEEARPSDFARVAVAWDASREAVRAVHDALPLLRLARSVETVAMVDSTGKDDELDLRRLAAHLKNHGVPIEPRTQKMSSANEHAALREQLAHGHYDLIVMGGYSHSIWREFIFGGATQSILLSSRSPILVSH
ncbi:MAG TPA: universal stress protein [Stellaceae bacterium]|nr:universal stress protein [Stellaceae bacterium]